MKLVVVLLALAVTGVALVPSAAAAECHTEPVGGVGITIRPDGKPGLRTGAGSLGLECHWGSLTEIPEKVLP